MKQNKKNVPGALLEGLAEIVVTLIFFGIGALIISLFGVSIDSLDIDGDVIVLIGIVVPIVIFAIISALVQWLKKTLGGERK